MAARGQLDRGRIVRAAIALIDEHGMAALTMRRLGQQLGVEAMSLYAHVQGRENLVDSIIAEVVDDLYGDPEVQRQASDSWQDYLVRVAHGVRRSALAHPNVFPLVATRPPEAPWIRPPLRSLAWVEALLGNLDDYGFTDDQAVYTYRAFTSFLLGHLLLEVAGHGAQVGPEPVPVDAPVNPLVLDDYPRLQTLAARLAEDHAQEEFEDSLDNLIIRLEALRRGR